MPNFPSDYFTVAGANAGIYTDPATNLVVQGGICGTKIELPCGFKKDLRVDTIEAVDSPCIIKWCDVFKAIKSIAGSSALEADAVSAAFTMSAPTQTAAIANANLIAQIMG